MSNRSVLVGWRKRWNRTLLQFLRQRVRTRVDIEDLAQETYLRLLRAPDLGEVRNPQAYLLRIAGHVIAEWRDHQPPPDRFDPVEEAALADDRTPEFELETHLSQERLNEALARVSPMMRAVLLLRLRDSRPYKAIAEELSITDRQVKRYLVRGYECLRRALEERN